MEQQVDAPSTTSTLQAPSRRFGVSSNDVGAASRHSKLPVDASRSAVTTMEQQVDHPSSKSTLQGEQRR
eukprot:3641215-Rhodomonas_salina.1